MSDERHDEAWTVRVVRDAGTELGIILRADTKTAGRTTEWWQWECAGCGDHGRFWNSLYATIDDAEADLRRHAGDDCSEAVAA